jgi:hypothetical protein
MLCTQSLKRNHRPTIKENSKNVEGLTEKSQTMGIRWGTENSKKCELKNIRILNNFFNSLWRTGFSHDWSINSQNQDMNMKEWNYDEDERPFRLTVRKNNQIDGTELHFAWNQLSGWILIRSMKTLTHPLIRKSDSKLKPSDGSILWMSLSESMLSTICESLWISLLRQEWERLQMIGKDPS